MPNDGSRISFQGIDAKLVKLVSSAAGIGGICAIVLLYVYRDLVGSEIFPRLDRDPAAFIVGAIVICTFLLAIVGIGAWIISRARKDEHFGAAAFLVLAGAVLAFLFLLADLVVSPGLLPQPSTSTALRNGIEALQQGDVARAGRLLDESEREEPASPEPHYWKARLAERVGNRQIALEHLFDALDKDPTHLGALVLKVQLMILNGTEEGSEVWPCVQIPVEQRPEMAPWIDCLERNGLLSAPFTTRAEIETACPPPGPGSG